MLVSARQDIRTKRTREAIIVAMRELLEESKFQDITTNDICSKAMVSRTTFYQYFEDKYDLALTWIKTDIKPPSELFKDETLEEYFTQLLEAEKKYHIQICNLSRPGIAQELQWRIIAMWADGLKSYYGNQQQQGANFDVPHEIIITYDVAGLMFAIWWLIEHNFALPIAHMVSFLVRKVRHSKEFTH